MVSEATEGSGRCSGDGEMDVRKEFPEALGVLVGRLSALEPEYASNILKWIVVQEKTQAEIRNLALASDTVFQATISSIMEQLHFPPSLPEHVSQLSASTSRLRLNSGDEQLSRPSQQLYAPDDLVNPLEQERLAQMQALHALHSPQGHFDEGNFATMCRMASGTHLSQLSSGDNSPVDGMQAFAWKPCVYFARGYCKHGSSCRFLHGPNRDDETHITGNQQPFSHGTQTESGGGSGSLEQLEVELCELLRGRRAPVSIASLPQLYYERFGRTLQAEGYLTESQRHGKAGFSLTKLLARLKNTVTLIDRPHGQHAVVLAEEAHRFIRQKDNEEQMSVRTSPVSRQIYLTFPSESTFTEDDVRNHFRQYGDVQDVRIPYQNKRMFGFVTFLDSSTVKTILAEGNPHYICGARVLVKPYREKGKHAERSKFVERSDFSRHPLTRTNENKELCFAHGMRLFCGDTYGLQLEHMHEVQKRQLLRRAESQVPPRWLEAGEVSPASQLFQNNGICESEFKAGVEEGRRFPAQNRFSYLLDGLDANSSRDNLQRHEEELMVQTLSSSLASSSTGSLSSTHGSSHNLPESPFLGSYDTPEDFRPFRRVPKAASYESLGSHSFAASSNPVSVISDHDLTCCICFEYFVDPLTLDCAHTFCQRCISQFLKAKEECPICRRQVAVNRLNKESGRGESHLTTPLHLSRNPIPAILGGSGNIWQH